MKLTHKIALIAAAGLLAVSPAAPLMNKQTNTVQAAAKKSKKKTITVGWHNNDWDYVNVFSKYGHRLKQYKGKKAHVKDNVSLRYYGGPRVIRKHVYFSIGSKGYIKGDNVVKLNGRNVMTVGHNAYIYGKNGRRLQTYRGKRSNTLVYKGMPLTYKGKIANLKSSQHKVYYFYKIFNTSGPKGWILKDKAWLPYKTIKGKQYYYLGAGGYIKAANITAVNNHSLWARSAVITLAKHPDEMYSKSRIPIYNQKGNMTSHTLRGGTKIQVDKEVSTDVPEMDAVYDFDYFRVKGRKDQYILSTDVAKFPLQYMESKEIHRMITPWLDPSYWYATDTDQSNK